MCKEDVDVLVEQIRNIILNKPLSLKKEDVSEGTADLQEAITYLSNCLSESNEFLRQLAIGNLEAHPPSRHNFLAGSLKELHSGFKHLIWQVNQVANGDYNQNISFFGDLSSSFNRMIHQLSERELQLTQQAVRLNETTKLMKAIMDGLKDWIIVTSKETGEVIYTNQAARLRFYDQQKQAYNKEAVDTLLACLKECEKNKDQEQIFEYKCENESKILRNTAFSLQWNETLAYVHYIVDITHEKEVQVEMEGLAYTDELTDLYNRRYCFLELERVINLKESFSLCMIDLNGLKHANDHFGHEAGDHYLKCVAEELRRISRSQDIACRIGGDEFALIFPQCREDILLSRMALINERLNEKKCDYPMAISYGVVYVEKNSTIDAGTIMNEADRKMYLFKNAIKHKKRGESVYTIKEVTSKIDWNTIEPIEIDCYPWGEAYMPKTTAWLYHIENEGFMLKMRCEEKEPRATYTEENDPVYKDSCMEFFANYYPREEGTGYINFEMNSNGVVLCQYGTPEERYYLKDKGLDVPQPVVVKEADYWEVELMIPDQFIKTVYGKDHLCNHVKGNFYKCGDDTHTPHYGSWRPIENLTPAFHKPAFFGELVIKNK